MTTTTMHFGPEWMRTKGSTRPAPSPPLATSPVPPGNSTYSALVTPTTNPPSEGRDVAHPFRYSKEEMLRIYKEGGGRGGLGLEVERWEGIVREIGYEPVGLKEMSESEKKLFAGPLNSEVRRRQSSDYLSLNTTGLGDRPKLNHVVSATGSPMRERIGGFMGRRRDSTDQTPLTIPRKLSLSNMQGGLISPREGALPSPRLRVGLSPGFDGVLSETWSARRRNADPNKATNGTNKPDKEGEGIAKGPESKEAGDTARDPQNGSGETAREARAGAPAANDAGDAKAATAADRLNGQLSKLSVNGQPDTNPQPVVDATKPPPGLGDLSSIEWSYLDPQGNVQGPFRADVMQRWFNEGYFTPDLLMKRTHIDTDWTPVAELMRRAGDQPVFLTPLVHSIAPPGLNRRLDTVVDSGILERNQQSPYQPVPTRNLRSSTLDSYLVNGSNGPESPSSSFGGRFTNGSPDRGIFENRIGGQIGFNQGVESRLPFAAGPGQRRATLNDSVEPVFGNRAFGNLGAVRTQGLDGIGFSGNESPSVFNDGLSSPFGQRTVQNPTGSNGHTGPSALNGAEIGPIGGIHSNQGTPSRVLARDAFGRDDIHGGSFSNGSSPFISHAQPAFPQTPLSHYAAQDQRSLHSMTPISDRQSISSPPFSHQLQQQFTQNPTFGTAQSPWHPAENATYRRPGPFDPVHPTASNTFVQPIAPAQSLGRNTPGAIPTEQSPWQTPVKPTNNDPWGPTTSNLTTANLGQHDEQHRQAELQQHQQQQQPQTAPAPAQPQVSAPSTEPQTQVTPSPAAAPAAPSPTESAPQKSRRKSSAQPAQTTSQVPKVSPPEPVAKPPSPAPAPAPTATPAETKPAWGMDDEKKAKIPGAPLTLREIQEAEAKKLEARKAAERERERAARAAAVASAQAEDFQPFTASWGLPTSQAGARSHNNATKDAIATSAASPAPAPPVWTNAAKAPVAKKTMKEIQEEEERRKKLAAAKEKESMATAAKRGYAETTTKPGTPAQQVGGAWTTVGSGGKTAATAVTATRPVATTAAPAKPAPATPAAVASPAPRPTAAATPRPAAVALKSTPSKEDNGVVSGPSLEFLKWLSDALKGLNSSVNLEEITSMLLSFPLDPDQTTMEIISDLIYASSTTLDGRRFAAEFVHKRKADATARPKGTSASSASAKPVSIADIVKAQPKPAQNEWGGFKVVNKKKKGGRA